MGLAVGDVRSSESSAIANSVSTCNGSFAYDPNMPSDSSSSSLWGSAVGIGGLGAMGSDFGGVMEGGKAVRDSESEVQTSTGTNEVPSATDSLFWTWETQTMRLEARRMIVLTQCMRPTWMESSALPMR